MKLDAHLNRFADLVKQKLGKNIQEISGAGAACGLRGAFAGCLGADMQSGIEMVLHYTHAAEKMKHAGLVFTGEGSLDSQSICGKVPVGVAELARKQGKKVIGIAGRIDTNTKLLNEHIDAVFSIQTQCRSLEEAMQPEVMEQQIKVTVEQICRLITAN